MNGRIIYLLAALAGGMLIPVQVALNTLLLWGDRVGKVSGKSNPNRWGWTCVFGCFVDCLCKALAHWRFSYTQSSAPPPAT
jgi:hypothetical protein